VSSAGRADGDAGVLVGGWWAVVVSLFVMYCTLGGIGVSFWHQ
jgi:hypothetical protein